MRRDNPCTPYDSPTPTPVGEPPAVGWFPSSWSPYGLDWSAAKTVRAGENLQTALSNAQPGDILTLEAGATWRGNFRLPVKTGDNPIFITTTAYERLPPLGTRITPTQAGLLPRLVSPNNIAALTADPRSHHWRIRGLRFGAEVYNNSLVRFGSGMEKTTAELCHHFDLMQCLIEGHPTIGCKRGVQVCGEYITIRDCWINQIRSNTQDSQAICGWSLRWLWVENNFLEAAGENFFLGEYTQIPGSQPSDVVVSRNHIYKPMAWKGEFKPGTTSPKWIVKNLFELKAGRRIHVFGNTLENCWPSAQRGSAFNLKPGHEHTVSVPMTEDVMIECNLIINTGTPIQITGAQPSALGTGYTRRVTIRHNAFVELKPSQFLVLLTGPPVNDIRITDNTFLAPGYPACASLYLPVPNVTNLSSGLDYSRNIVSFGTGVKADGKTAGKASLDATYSSWQYNENVHLGLTPTAAYPPNNIWDDTLAFGAAGGYAQDEYALGADDAIVKAATGGDIVAP